MATMSTCLWFDGMAEQAATFYTEVFANSAITEVARLPGDGGVLSVLFTLDGRPFRALNGGPQFSFSEAISFELFFDTPAALDAQWAALCADGGQPGRCGWLKDKFGVSWQLIPTMLGSVLGGPDAAGAARALQAMLGMEKLDAVALQAAYDAAPATERSANA